MFTFYGWPLFQKAECHMQYDVARQDAALSKPDNSFYKT